MAEFIRIWDDTIVNTDGSLGDYVEYDTTVVESETVYVPVSNISISRPINAGVINKVIDTNDVIKRFQALEVAQIQKFITVEKSYENRFSIERSNAKSINIESARNNIIVNTSGIGQKGEKGNSGKDSVLDFSSDGVFDLGRLVTIDGTVWLARVDLDGRLTPLENPTEGTQWTEVANRNSILDLPLVSGYEISEQSDWDVVEPIIEFGDLVRISSESEELTLDLFNETKPIQTASIGKPLVDTNGNEFFAVGGGGGGSSAVLAVQGSNFSPIVAQDFIDALNNANIVFGEDKFSGNNTIIQTRSAFGTGGTTGIQILSVSLTSTTPTHVLNVIVADENGNSTISNIEFSTPIGDNPSGRFFDNISPGIEIGSTVIDLAAGDKLYFEGEEEQTLQTITNVIILGGKTYYEVEDYTGFESGGNIVGRIVTTQTVSTNLWYIRNENIASSLDKLDILSNDPVIKDEIDAIKELGDGVTNPRFINEFARDRATTFFGTNTNTTNPERFEQPDQSRIKILYNRLFGGTSTNENGTGYSSSSITALGATDYSGIEDGAQQNFIDAVTTNSKNLKITPVTDTDGVTTNTLSSNAEVNLINTVDDTSGSILSLDNKQVSATLASATGGTDEGGKLILLNPDGFIPSTAITQVNLSSVTIFETTSERNASTDTAWSTGDTTIIPGVPNLSIGSTAFLDNGTTIVVTKVDDTEDSDGDFDPLPTSGDLNLLSNNNVFKRITYTYDASTDLATDTTVSDQVTFTHTLTVTEPFTGDDVTDFLTKAERTAVTTATGTFVYKSSSQTPGDTTATPPETVGQTTDGDDWAEIVPTGGVVTSINGSSGVVTLGVANVNGLEDRLDGTDGKVDKVSGSRLITSDELTQIGDNKTAIGEPDRDPTQDEIDDGVYDVDDIILGSGLERDLDQEIKNRGDGDSTIVGSVGTIDANDDRIDQSGYLGGDADLQDSKQDKLTDGTINGEVLSWDGDSWEPGITGFPDYDSSAAYLRKDIVTINGRIALGDTIRLVINVSPDGAFDQLRLSDGSTTIFQAFCNETGTLKDAETADGETITLAAGTPGAIPAGIGGSGQIRIFPNQSEEGTASDIASILPYSLSIRNLSALYTVHYFGGNTIYLTKSIGIDTLVTLVENPSWDTTFDEFVERGIDASIWFAKNDSNDVTPGTDSNIWRQIDNKDEVSEYDSTRIYSVKELVTVGRVGLGEVIRLKINTPQSGGGQQLDLRESTVGGRFIQVFSNDSPGNLSDTTGVISLAPGTPGSFSNGSIRISAGQTATAVASDLASILPHSLSVRNITGFTVHYFGDDTVYISKVSSIGTLNTAVEGGDWDTTFDKHAETGLDVNTFISLRDSNTETPGTNRSAWGKLNTVNNDGDIELLDNEAGIILRDTDGKRYRITVGTDGNLNTIAIT